MFRTDPINTTHLRVRQRERMRDAPQETAAVARYEGAGELCRGDEHLATVAYALAHEPTRIAFGSTQGTVAVIAGEGDLPGSADPMTLHLAGGLRVAVRVLARLDDGRYRVGGSMPFRRRDAAPAGDGAR